MATGIYGKPRYNPKLKLPLPASENRRQIDYQRNRTTPAGMQRLVNVFIFLSGALSLLYSGLLQAQVSVYLDRYAINANETVLLTVEVDQRSARRPDFFSAEQRLSFPWQQANERFQPHQR